MHVLLVNDEYSVIMYTLLSTGTGEPEKYVASIPLGVIWWIMKSLMIQVPLTLLVWLQEGI